MNINELINKRKEKSKNFLDTNIYDYSLVPKEFISTDKIDVICPIHGKFSVNVWNHINGSGCPKCGIKNNSVVRKKTTEEFVKQAQQVHQNSDGSPKYDYSKVVYNGSGCHVIITCPIHGDFKQIAGNHLLGKGCRKCSPLRDTTSNFISKAQQIHKNSDGSPKYNYSKVVYESSLKKVIITCPIHGDFEQLPQSHLRGNGCKKCGYKEMIKKQTPTIEQFINKAQHVHQNSDGSPKYDYSKTNYINSNYYVKITCPIHGDFEQLPTNHIKGSGCPTCGNIIPQVSKAENDLREFIKSLNIDIVTNYRNICSKEIDIYIPSKKIGIEYNGLYWHSELHREKDYHLQKTIECENKGVQLIHIFEDEWLEKRLIVQSRISQLLGLTKYRLYARKCKLRVLNIQEERTFFNNNHLQGFVGSSVCYGLTYTLNNKEYIVAAMSFGPLRKNLGSTQQDSVYEMYRFACMKNFSIVGGASKLFKHFLKRINPKQVISYADRRWSTGNLYKQLGFEFSNYTQPSYFYVDGKERKNRFAMRKDILVSKYDCPTDKSEHDFCYDIGLYRIYDCGNLKFIWSNK